MILKLPIELQIKLLSISEFQLLLTCKTLYFLKKEVIRLKLLELFHSVDDKDYEEIFVYFKTQKITQLQILKGFSVYYVEITADFPKSLNKKIKKASLFGFNGHIRDMEFLKSLNCMDKQFITPQLFLEDIKFLRLKHFNCSKTNLLELPNEELFLDSLTSLVCGRTTILRLPQMANLRELW